MSTRAVELILLWHHHQPDYRRAQDHCAMLPWVRLHAAKDYLEMAVRLGRHPGVKSTFNFVPSLLDQIDEAAAGAPDLLFDRLAKPVATLDADDREELLRRCVQAPRHALDRWPVYRQLADRAKRSGRGNARVPFPDRDLVRLECFLLLAWIDPLHFDEPEAAAAIAAIPNLDEGHRDALLVLYRRLCERVIPEYRARAESGQVELAISPYYHPILPLLIDGKSARRARPDMPLPRESFAAPEDARLQIERARKRADTAFGALPNGTWPPEGSVSPEAAELLVSAGVKWIATDEGVLWNSLDSDQRQRRSLYSPWKFATPAGDLTLFFRDHEISERIGFVYQNWRTEDAVADFLERVRKAGRERGGDEPATVSVILDGENCWEYYPDDGGPFLDALYTALENATDIVTRTPSEVIGAARELPRLSRLHTGSWIDADFHIWIGHPEKNRAWELLTRARRTLVERGITPEAAPEAWESIYAAEGSDWFWWFGDDHYTADKALFDQLFRLHLRAAYERAGLSVPGSLDVAITQPARKRGPDRVPTAFVRPTIDGRRTGFYEWHGAARYPLHAGGGAMHQSGGGLATSLLLGFDAECLYLRVDFTSGKPPGGEYALWLEMITPIPGRIAVMGLEAGNPQLLWVSGDHAGHRVDGAHAAVNTLLEVAIPFASLGLSTGDAVEMIGRLVLGTEPLETLPDDDLMRFRVPDAQFDARMWSA
jgi:alpha-amylase/alpha-mannosidase (GH57 family)